MDRRFRMMRHVHNETVLFAMRQYHKLKHDKAYNLALKGYRKAKAGAASAAKAGHLSAEDAEAFIRRACKPWLEKMNGRVSYFALTKAGLESYAAVMQHAFKNHLGSQQVQKEADRVYAGVKKLLYGGGKQLRLKKLNGFTTISNKSLSGAYYTDEAHPSPLKKHEQVYPRQFDWLGICAKVRADWDDPYVMESLAHKISYVEIKRRMFSDGWHYSILLYLNGGAPERTAIGRGDAGLDPGVSTMAAESAGKVLLEELAPRCREYDKETASLQKRIDRSLRLTNPDNYSADGTVKKGRHKWKTSRQCAKNKRKLSQLFRQKHEYTVNEHRRLVKKVLAMGDVFHIEKMDYPALAKRSKKLDRRSEAVKLRKAKHQEVLVRKYKRKKRFGKSISDRSPGLFVSLLTEAAGRYGGRVIMVDTRKCKASQYDHAADAYVNHPLSQRKKLVGGKEVLRDPYSAFILRHSDAEGTHDREGCIKDFDTFIEKQAAMMAEAPSRRPACFGF